jgi:hypothetical protein
VKIIVTYICVSRGARSEQYARRFVSTYQQFPAQVEHELIVVFNGGKPPKGLRSLFDPIPHGWHERSNEGWDIAAYQDVAIRVNPALLMCLGEQTYFHRAGWLRRLSDAREAFGPGMYGAYSSFLVSPHLNTTSFACSPEFIRQYPVKCKTRADRYNFEHGRNALWRWIAGHGYPTKLVTWDGEWDQPDWRTPPNILWRGDQSNCLTWCQHTDKFFAATPETKQAWSDGADGIARPRPITIAVCS